MKNVHILLLCLLSLMVLLAADWACGQAPAYVSQRSERIQKDYDGKPIGYGDLHLMRRTTTGLVPEDQPRHWLAWFDPKTQTVYLDLEGIISAEFVGVICHKRGWDFVLADATTRFTISHRASYPEGRRERLALLKRCASGFQSVLAEEPSNIHVW